MGNNKDYKRSCMCQKPAVPGAPPMPEYPSLPINELCDKDWLYVESANKCIYHDIQERAWDAAQDLCRDKGGDLVSINSPAENLEILQILGSFFIDLTSIGKFKHFGVDFLLLNMRNCLMNKYTMSIFVSMEMSHGTSLSQSVRKTIEEK